MRISQVMKKAYVIDENISAKEAAKIMSHKKIGGLVVIDKDRISGILTERDIIRNLSKLNEPVASIMTKNIISVSPDDDSQGAAELMSTHKIKRLPVINNGKLVGMVRVTDIIGKTDAMEEGEFFFE